MTVAGQHLQQHADTIRVGGVELSSAGIKPVTGNLATLIKAEDVNDVTGHYGARSAHPIVQIVVGAAMSLLLIDTIQNVIHWLRHGGVMMDIELLLAIPGGLGVWLLIDAFSRGYYLLVRTNGGQQKIVFERKTPPETVNDFCEKLPEKKYHVVVDAVL
jgi:hypothetical protein